jgi:hypothetical protein
LREKDRLGRKKPFGKPRRSWENNVKMALRDVGREGMDWIDLVQDWDSGGHLCMR